MAESTVGSVGSTVDLDRVAGSLVGLAAGDALGATYEFTVPGKGADIVQRANNTWARGEWTDDTAQAVGIAEVAATGSMDPLAIGGRFLDWHREGPKDCGISTAAVLGAARTSDRLADAAADYFARLPRGAAGNGSLMRTAPVALAHLGDDVAIAEHATRISLLTHGDPLAAEGCVLWCIAIDRAVREGRLDGVRDGIALLEPDRATFWAERLDEAETRDPHSFSHGNGFVVTALQAAYAVIRQVPIPSSQPARHLQDVLAEAVRIGNDTDTVAAIAGQVLGARWGYSAIPWDWRRHLHGWPDLHEHDLVRLAVLTARAGASDRAGWPAEASLVGWGRDEERRDVCVDLEADGPDAGGAITLGNLRALPVALERGADAVVSLCRVGANEVPAGVTHARFWISDRAEVAANPNLDFALEDAAAAIASLRAEGRRVFVHCVGGRSRTPTVAAAYLSRRDGVSHADALARLRNVLPDIHLNARFAHL